MKIPTGHILIRLWHPTKDLAYASSLFEMPCLTSWTAGSPRQTPSGQLLSGNNSQSYWCSEQLEFSGESGFEKELAHTIERLASVENHLHDFRASGGKIEIYLQLPGSINNGDTIASEHLKTLGKIGIDLSIEVFP